MTQNNDNGIFNLIASHSKKAEQIIPEVCKSLNKESEQRVAETLCKSIISKLHDPEENVININVPFELGINHENNDPFYIITVERLNSLSLRKIGELYLLPKVESIDIKGSETGLILSVKITFNALSIDKQKIKYIPPKINGEDCRSFSSQMINCSIPPQYQNITKTIVSNTINIQDVMEDISWSVNFDGGFIIRAAPIPIIDILFFNHLQDTVPVKNFNMILYHVKNGVEDALCINNYMRAEFKATDIAKEKSTYQNINKISNIHNVSNKAISKNKPQNNTQKNKNLFTKLYEILF
jgi:hypothetical protein